MNDTIIINNKPLQEYARFTRATPYESPTPIDISFISAGSTDAYSKVNLPNIGETITFDDIDYYISGYAIDPNGGIWAFTYSKNLDECKWLIWDSTTSSFSAVWTAETTEYELLMRSEDGNILSGASFYIGLLNQDYVEAITNNWVNYSFLNTYQTVELQ